MKKAVILIAGMPGTGKSRFADYLSSRLKITLICKDKIKELIWGKVQYDSGIRAESQKYGALSYDISFHFCEMLMKSEHPIIFESNFTNPCPDFFVNMIRKYGYKAITVLFNGDAEVIHKRFLDRDITSERHPSLVTNGYFSDFETFMKATLPCRDFDFGDVRIAIDTSDFSKVSYDDITKKISASLEE